MYNFDEIIDRQHTNALSTDGFRGYIFHAGPEKVFPYKDDEFVRMWVADMDFGVAPEILDEMRKRIDRRIFGYTGVYDHDYYNSFVKWCKDHYDWEFPEEELCFSPGIIPALYQFTETLCTPDEKVLINTPAYGYFLHAAEYAHVEPLYSPLKKREDGTFELDYENFEAQCANPQCKLIFWCNPQNPSGRMWTEEELACVARIVEKYNLWIISDEIHKNGSAPGKTPALPPAAAGGPPPQRREAVQSARSVRGRCRTVSRCPSRSRLVHIWRGSRGSCARRTPTRPASSCGPGGTAVSAGRSPLRSQTSLRLLCASLEWVYALSISDFVPKVNHRAAEGNSYRI